MEGFVLSPHSPSSKSDYFIGCEESSWALAHDSDDFDSYGNDLRDHSSSAATFTNQPSNLSMVSESRGEQSELHNGAPNQNANYSFTRPASPRLSTQHFVTHTNPRATFFIPPAIPENENPTSRRHPKATFAIKNLETTIMKSELIPDYFGVDDSNKNNNNNNNNNNNTNNNNNNTNNKPHFTSAIHHCSSSSSNR